MRKIFLVLMTVWLVPAGASALEIKNVRPCFGPFGATRTDLKAVLPGDVVFMSYDIDGLTVDPKTSKVRYSATLELLDSAQKSLYKKETPSEALPQLGGKRMPGDLYIQLGSKQPAGKYTIRLTVADLNAKETKSFDYPFMIAPESFGLVMAIAPAIGLPGQPYALQFSAVNLGLDTSKKPNFEIVMKVKENKELVAAPIYIKEIPENMDLTKENLVPLQFPIFLNRPGNFQVEITATDKVGNHTAQLTYPLTVLDVPAIISGK